MSTLPRVALMVAMAQNRCIGINNTLPWHLPEDLKHFKRTTSAKPVIMGRKTYDSIGRPLPNRTNIVITRNHQWQAPGTEVASSLLDAIAIGQQSAKVMGAKEMVIMGGAQIYAQALSDPSIKLDCLYLTRVFADVDGDAFFPVFDEALWQIESQQHFASDKKNPFSYSFECWVKR